MNRIDRNFCMLDGQPCTCCYKCEHMPVSKQSNNWINKLLIAIIFVLLFLLLLSPLLSFSYNFAIDVADTITGYNNDDNIIKETNNNINSYDNNYQNYPPPKRYYDTNFFIYDYPNNPATCGGGNCPTSQFAYS